MHTAAYEHYNVILCYYCIDRCATLLFFIFIIIYTFMFTADQRLTKTNNVISIMYLNSFHISLVNYSLPHKSLLAIIELIAFK